MADGPGRPQKEDEPRSQRLYFYTTSTKAEALRDAAEPISDIVNRLVDAYLDGHSSASQLEVARVEAELDDVRQELGPLQQREEELVALRRELKQQETLKQFQDEQADAFRDQLRAYVGEAKAKAARRAGSSGFSFDEALQADLEQWTERAIDELGLAEDRAREIVEEETGIEVKASE